MHVYQIYKYAFTMQFNGRVHRGAGLSAQESLSHAAGLLSANHTNPPPSIHHTIVSTLPVMLLFAQYSRAAVASIHSQFFFVVW